ncbi:MAG: pro-sigmaK processing inhibitor BofA family protein [Bacillota bacterium]|nr:pro-sigmaK processing inhibitor BofA family protein [Bacillota bacterium]
MIDVNIIFAILLAVFLIWIIGNILLKPIKLVVKLIYNSIIGLVLLLVINFIGGFFGLTIAINLITVLVAGLLGVPGLGLLVILQYLLG